MYGLFVQRRPSQIYSQNPNCQRQVSGQGSRHKNVEAETVQNLNAGQGSRHKNVKAETVQNLKAFFGQFDVNGDGRLSWRELTSAFQKLGATAPAWEAIHALLRADENGDLRIGEHELDALIKCAVESGYVVVIENE